MGRSRARPLGATGQRGWGAEPPAPIAAMRGVLPSPAAVGEMDALQISLLRAFWDQRGCVEGEPFARRESALPGSFRTKNKIDVLCSVFTQLTRAMKDLLAQNEVPWGSCRLTEVFCKVVNLILLRFPRERWGWLWLWRASTLWCGALQGSQPELAVWDMCCGVLR